MGKAGARLLLKIASAANLLLHRNKAKGMLKLDFRMINIFVVQTESFVKLVIHPSSLKPPPSYLLGMFPATSFPKQEIGESIWNFTHAVLAFVLYSIPKLAATSL